MNNNSSPPHIAYILRSYPRLSQTFVVNEIWALEQLGASIHIFAMTNPQEPLIQNQVAAVRAPVDYLDVALQQSLIKSILQHWLLLCMAPFRYFKTFWYVLTHAECDEGYTTISRFKCFQVAVYFIHRLREEQRRRGIQFEHIHAHFAHDPTLIAQLAHGLSGLSFSFTAHARDLYQIPKTALQERVAASEAVVTCCGANLDFLHSVIAPAAYSKMHLIYHGVNLQQFHQAQPLVSDPKRQCSQPLLLSIGRLVDKKGFPDLIQACALLQARGYHFRCLIFGEGPLEESLTAQINELGLQHTVQLMGACTQEEIVAILQSSDIFVLTPYMTQEGDRDGIPNVLVEAMACGLPVVSTRVGGISELIKDHHNGLLAAPQAITDISDRLSTLLDNGALCQQLGMAARQTVESCFDLQIAAHQLLEIIHPPYNSLN